MANQDNNKVQLKDKAEVTKVINTDVSSNSTESQRSEKPQRQGGRDDQRGRYNNNRRNPRNDNRKAEADEFTSYTVMTRRTAKVVKGGKKMRFSAMVVVGNKKGRIGYAMGKGPDPKSAIEKATKRAKRSTFMITVVEDTIPHEVMHKFGAAVLFLKPAPEGTGVIASSIIRSVVESAGIKNIYSKMYGTRNKVTNIHCVMDALKNLKSKRIESHELK